MGNHYVPRKYLEAFATATHPKCVWQYDKKCAAFSDGPVSIRTVAQQRGFYDEETEKELNELVERPANVVIDRLRNGGTLEPDGRAPLSMYIATMLYRVPRKRQRGYDAIPGTLVETVTRFKEVIAAAHRDGAIDDATAERRATELNATHAKFAAKAPEELIEIIRNPWPTEDLVRYIFSMNWYLQRSSGPSYFVTSDNPVFIFECYGVASPESELTFPLAPDLAIFGTWQPVKEQRNPGTSQAMVKEANRRVISAAHRFIYSHVAADWIPRVAAKPSPRLSRIMGT